MSRFFDLDDTEESRETFPVELCQACKCREVCTYLDVQFVIEKKYICFKRCYICKECLDELQPDMWINKEGWDSLIPLTTFEELEDISG